MTKSSTTVNDDLMELIDQSVTPMTAKPVCLSTLARVIFTRRPILLRDLPERRNNNKNAVDKTRVEHEKNHLRENQ